MFRVFQSVRGLADDSVTRLDKNEDLAWILRHHSFYVIIAWILRHHQPHIMQISFQCDQNNQVFQPDR